MKTDAVVELKDVNKWYGEFHVLRNINLQVGRGEKIVICGPSGSGKSTMIRCINRLEEHQSGDILVKGTALTSDLKNIETVRREVGMVFQHFNLFPHLTVLENCCLAPIWVKQLPRKEAEEIAMTFLRRVRIPEQALKYPGQLSGGQQQRVSIARALANGGEVILADEPTGALDSHSGKEVMAILKELHEQGHTIILVTHDMAVANHANRIITLRDGRVVEDSGQPAASPVISASQAHGEESQQIPQTAVDQVSSGLPGQAANQEVREPAPDRIATASVARRGSQGWDRYREAGRMALHAMLAHRMRTFLTMLGIIIGIAAVVSVVALGQGARAKVIDDINAMGTNTIDIFPGKDWGDEKAASIQTLNERDLDALLGQPYLEGASPQIATSGQLRYRNKTSSGSVVGVGSDFFRVKGMTLTQGRLLDERDIRSRTAVAVVDGKTIASLLGKTDPVGQVVLVGTLPVRIVGVVAQETGFGPSSQSVNVWLPYSAVMSRLISQNHFSQITIRVKDGVQPALAEQAAVALLTQRHGVKDFFTFSSDSIVKSVEKTTATLTLLVSAIAVISLIVGGVGVMNIMLVSVVERTREIGIRIAVGARQSDILQQFLIEAVMVSLLGGLLGIGLAMFIGFVFSLLVESFQMRFSLFSILMAFGCSSLIGILFGYLPARNAARLDPVEALARE